MLILSIIVCALESGEITNGNEKEGSDSSCLPSVNQKSLRSFFQVRRGVFFQLDPPPIFPKIQNPLNNKLLLINNILINYNSC